MSEVRDTYWVKQCHCLFWGIPLWWVLGIEQFVWFFLMVSPLMYRAAGGGGGRSEVPQDRLMLLSYGVLLISIVISGASVVEMSPGRVLCYLLDISIFFLGLCVIVCLRSLDSSRQMQERLIETVARVVGVLMLFGVGLRYVAPTLEFNSLLYYLSPEYIVKTDMGMNILVKRVVSINTDWLKGVDMGYRLRSTFVCSNSCAFLISMVIPLYLYRLLVGKVRVFELGALCVSVCALFFTTSRTSMVTAVFGVMMIGGLHLFFSWRYSVVNFALLAVCSVMLLSVLFVVLEHYHLIFNELVYARGPGSYHSRSMIYVESFKATLERPWGHGSRLDFMPGVPPLGSHSTYIAIMFKYGFIGVGAYLAFLARVLYLSFVGLRQSEVRSRDYYFFLCVFSSLLGACIGQITHEVTYDIMIWIVFCIICRIAISRHACLKGVAGAGERYGLVPTGEKLEVAYMGSSAG